MLPIYFTAVVCCGMAVCGLTLYFVCSVRRVTPLIVDEPEIEFAEIECTYVELIGGIQDGLIVPWPIRSDRRLVLTLAALGTEGMAFHGYLRMASHKAEFVSAEESTDKAIEALNYRLGLLELAMEE